MFVTDGTRLAWAIQRRFPNDHPATVLRRLLREARIRVTPYPFTDEIAGLFWRPRGRPVIAVNAWHPRERQRFTAAHEYYHFATGARGSVICPNLFDSVDPQERAANTFAAELLMPARVLARLVADGADTATIEWVLGVSHDALNWRLRELGFLRAMRRRAA